MIKIKNLNEPIDYYGKAWIVNTITKEDLMEKMPKEKWEKLTDEQMDLIANKLSDAILDACYWECLEGVLEYYDLT